MNFFVKTFEASQILPIFARMRSIRFNDESEIETGVKNFICTDLRRTKSVPVPYEKIS